MKPQIASDLKLSSSVSLNHYSETEFSENMKSLKVSNTNEFFPPVWLKHAESPFKWMQNITSESMIGCDLKIKLEEYSNQESCYSFERFSLLLILVFEHSIKKDIANAKLYLQQLDELFQNMSVDKNDHMYAKIGHAFEHVYLATKAQVAIIVEEGQLAEEHSRKIGASLKPVSHMTKEIQAGIKAMKAVFYLNYTKDTKLALHHMMEAAKLDPEFSSWQYWTGKVMRKHRHRENEGKEPKDELVYFESAVQKEKDPKHLVILAQAYQEKASYMYKTHCKETNYYKSSISNNVNFFNKKSLELYRECWSLNQDSATLCRHIGNGLMSLPRHYADDSLVKKILFRALQLSQNALTYHILGTFYFKYEQDDDKAKEYFKKAADHGKISAFHYLIRIQYLNDPCYDPYEDLKYQEEKLMFSPKLDSVYCDIIWYYLYFKNDLCKSLEYFWKVFEKDEDSVLLTNFKSESLFVYPPINLYSVLVNETLVLKNLNSASEQEHYWLKFLEEIENTHPELLLMTPNPQLMSSVRNRTEKYVDNLRRRRNTFSKNKLVKDHNTNFTFRSSGYKL